MITKATQKKSSRSRDLHAYQVYVSSCMVALCSDPSKTAIGPSPIQSSTCSDTWNHHQRLCNWFLRYLHASRGLQGLRTHMYMVADCLNLQVAQQTRWTLCTEASSSTACLIVCYRLQQDCCRHTRVQNPSDSTPIRSSNSSGQLQAWRLACTNCRHQVTQASTISDKVSRPQAQVRQQGCWCLPVKPPLPVAIYGTDVDGVV